MDQKYLSMKFAFGMEIPNCYISPQIFAHITVADSRKRIKLLFFSFQGETLPEGKLLHTAYNCRIYFCLKKT